MKKQIMVKKLNLSVKKMLSQGTIFCSADDAPQNLNPCYAFFQGCIRVFHNCLNFYVSNNYLLRIEKLLLFATRVSIGSVRRF